VNPVEAVEAGLDGDRVDLLGLLGRGRSAGLKFGRELGRVGLEKLGLAVEAEQIERGLVAVDDTAAGEEEVNSSARTERCSVLRPPFAR